MTDHNPIQDIKDEVVAEHVRRGEGMKPVTPTGPRRDLRRRPRTRMEQFFKENDIRQTDLV